jgi:hypothetical protein
MGVSRDSGDERVGGADLAVAELGHLGGPEPAGGRRGNLIPAGIGLAVAPAEQGVAGLAFAHLGQFRDPADPVVVDVPQPGEHAARHQHPGDLG